MRGTTLGLLALALCACSIDTEIGLAVEVRSATVHVRTDPAGDVVATSVDLDYRTGAHAPEEHELRPQTIEVYLDDSFVVGMSPDGPVGFDPRVPPGVSRSTTFTGESRPGVAMEPRRLCGATATVLFRWTDMGALGMAEGAATATCD